MASPDYARIVDELTRLVSIELYGVRGVVAGERLLVHGLREGAANVYLYDGSSLVRVNKEPVSGVAEPPRGSDTILLVRDVARGREQHLIYRVSVDRPGEEEALPGMEPARILGVVYDEEKIVYSASTEAGNYIILHDGSSPRMVAQVQGIAAPTDLSGRLVTGVGMLAGATGRFQLFTLDLDKGDLRVHDPGGSVFYARFTPDGRVVYGLEGPSRAELRAYDPSTGKDEKMDLPASDLEEYEPRAIGYIGYTEKGEIIVVARRDGRSRIFVDGRMVDAPEGIHGAVYEWRGSLVTSHTSLRNPARIVRVPGGEVVLQGQVPGFVEEALGDTVFEWVESFDGSKVPTFVLESRRAGKPGPTVVLVHGGPFSEDADYWNIFAASLAILGFNVVMPNYRGSTGYGEEWRLRIVGDPCGGELEDIASVAKWARESGIASRLYIMGYSYGGYMTMCALTRKPGLFRAGVAGASVVDWEMMYELSDAAFKSFIEVMFAGKRELWRERSPITYVDNMSDPLCIIHPQNDSRTPLKPVLRFMELASEKGKTFEAHIAPDMGHAVNRVEDVIKLVLPAAFFLAGLEARA